MSQLELSDDVAAQGFDSLEWLRFPGEAVYRKRLVDAVRATLPEPDAVLEVEMPSLDRARKGCLANCLRLSDKSAPELHQAMDKVRERLRTDIPYELFQVSGSENAASALVPDYGLIILQGGMISLLDDGTRLSLLGHELGHSLCHAIPESILADAISDMAIRAGTREGESDLRKAGFLFRQSCEITADRCGLLACRSIQDFLKLNMICATGLSASALEWDVKAYLEQCREFVAPLLKDLDAGGKGESGEGEASHPVHVIRAWAAGLFWESDLFHRMTGLGTGSLPIAQVDDGIRKVLEAMAGSGDGCADAGQERDEVDVPQEVVLCALAACVIVACADGEVSDEEEDDIERTFAGKVSAWRSYFNLQAATELLDQVAEPVMALGEKALLCVFLLACHVMIADGKVLESEVASILMVGRALGCEDLWFRLLVEKGVIRMAEDGGADGREGEKRRLRGLAPDRSRARRQADRDALDAYLKFSLANGGSKTTLGRLLNLMGAGAAREIDAYLPRLAEAIRKKGLLSFPDLATLDAKGFPHLGMQVVLSPESPVSREEAEWKGREKAEGEGADPATAVLVRALSSLQAKLVDGDGRSPSILIGNSPKRAVMDLMALARIDQSRPEQVRTMVCLGEEGDGASAPAKKVLLVSPEEAGDEDVAKVCTALRNIYRDDKEQQESQGSSDLCLGTSFVAGALDSGHRFRAPLRLTPVKLMPSEGGHAYGWSLARRGVSEPNMALIQKVMAKGGGAPSEELMERISAAAAESDDRLLAVLNECGFFFPGEEDGASAARAARDSLKAMAAQGETPSEGDAAAQGEKGASRASAPSSVLEDALRPIGMEPPCMTWCGHPVAEVQPCAALGVFPQSRNELLGEYADLLRDIQEDGCDVARALGGAAELLTPELRSELGLDGAEDATPAASRTPAAQTGIGNLSPGRRGGAASASAGTSSARGGGSASSAPAAPSSASPASPSAPLPAVPAVSLDPSQREALSAVRASKAMVIDGPPGTGKSQVIVGIVLDALARGERVAVVSEKRAALDVVAQRLAAAGLGDCYGLVHDVKDDRKELYGRVHARLSSQRPDAFDASGLRKSVAASADMEGALDDRRKLLSAACGKGCATLSSLLEQKSALEDRPEGRALSGACGGEKGAGTPGFWPRDVGSIPPDALSATADSLAKLRPFAPFMTPDSLWSGCPGYELPDAVGVDALAGFLEKAAEGLGARPEANGGSPRGAETGAGLATSWTKAVRAEVMDKADASGRSAFATPSPADLVTDWSAVASHLKAMDDSSAKGLLADIVWDDATPHVQKLLSFSGNFFRWLFPSFWKSRAALKAWISAKLRGLAGEPLSADFLSRLLLCAEDSAAFIAGADRPRRGDGAAALLAPGSALARAGGDPIRGALDDFWSHRDAAKAWLASNAPCHAGLLSAKGMDGLAALADASARFRQSLAPHGRCMEREVKEVLASIGRERDALLRWRDRSAQLEGALKGGNALAASFARLLPEGTEDDWKVGFYRGWNAVALASLQRAVPAVAKATAATPWGPEDEAAERLLAERGRAESLMREGIAHAVAVRGVMSTPAHVPGSRYTPAQAALKEMDAEASKSRRMMAMRTFVRKFSGQGLMDVLPVWMLSPETLCTLFPREPVFDLVVFDEASQSTASGGLPALIRGRRWVIAGDDRQMPPTSFFKSAAPEEGQVEEDVDEDVQRSRELFDGESLLTLARRRVPHARLTWHYRCQDESLIAFSNHAFYDASLASIPDVPRRDGQGCAKGSALEWVSVDTPEYVDGRNRPEAEKVVDLMSAELLSGSGHTLGVITLNTQQQATIQDAIEDRRLADPAFKEAYDKAMEAPMERRPFVRNLENVQGDERDVVFFSMGRAPQTRRNGTTFVSSNFGPVNKKGGERRLNVAVSRAKLKCVMVSSFEPELLSVADKSKSAGIRLLKLYLEYARSLSRGEEAAAMRILHAARVMNGVGVARDEENAGGRNMLPESVPLAVQVAVAAEKLGYSIEQHVGKSGFQVPLALLKDGVKPLAVLVDDGHDRLGAYDVAVHRPSLLKNRGWDVLRVNAPLWADQGTRKAILDGLKKRLDGGAEA